MKINLEDRIKASLESGKTFEEQLAEAKASGKRFATAHVGDKRAVYYHTDEELEHFKSYATPEQARAVSKLKIVERLDSAGLLETAYTALSQQPLVTQKRWEAAQTIASDDAETRAFLTAIGAYPDVILA